LEDDGWRVGIIGGKGVRGAPFCCISLIGRKSFDPTSQAKARSEKEKLVKYGLEFSM
jgi:hypothetical protein